MIRKVLAVLTCTLAGLSAAAAGAHAAPAPVLAQVKVTQANARSYIVETLVTVALMGGALYVVCRTGRRG